MTLYNSSRALRHAKKLMQKRKGFSITEIIIVIIIIGILAGVTIAVGNIQLSKSRKQTVTDNLKVLGSNIEVAISDEGFLKSVTDNSLNSNLTTPYEYFKLWDDAYLNCPLELSDMVLVDYNSTGTSSKGIIYGFGSEYSGAVIQTKKYEDPWGNELYIYYLIPATGNQYRIVIASAGPDGVFYDDYTKAYLDGDYDDDIVMVMIPRSYTVE